uniref:Pancreatic progenitor cell differentiation and proliferation factor n=2 Tax=Callithrix jacchus TaxID=9483 RepID=F7HG46_CALJA
MASIPSSGSLVAIHDYYRCCLGSTSSTQCPAEAIPHPPGIPKADPGHWWASFFHRKSTLPFMATVLESAEHPEPPKASSNMTTCGLAHNAPRKQPGGQSSTASSGPLS